MAKPRQKPACGNVNTVRLSSADELDIIKRRVAALKKDPQALRKLAQKAGILTKKGNLTKAFGG